MSKCFVRTRCDRTSGPAASTATTGRPNGPQGPQGPKGDTGDTRVRRAPVRRYDRRSFELNSARRLLQILQDQRTSIEHQSKNIELLENQLTKELAEKRTEPSMQQQLQGLSQVWPARTASAAPLVSLATLASRTRRQARPNSQADRAPVEDDILHGKRCAVRYAHSDRSISDPDLDRTEPTLFAGCSVRSVGSFGFRDRNAHAQPARLRTVLTASA